MILNLVEPGHPLLHEELEDFNFLNPSTNAVELANNLIETMTHYKGLGLSANQCGLPYRVFVLWSAEPLACFNPRIIDQTHDLVPLDEGCLTFPNLFMKIKRPSAIKVRFENALGETQTEKFTGMTARGFLHEMDHLDGILFTKRANPIHVDRAIRQQKQLNRQIKRGEVHYKPSKLPPVKINAN